MTVSTEIFLHAPDPARRQAKEQWLFTADVLTEVMSGCLDRVVADTPRITSIWTDHTAVVEATRRLGRTAAFHNVEREAPLRPGDLPTSHVVVLQIPDRAARWPAVLARAFTVVKPTGHLILIGRLEPGMAATPFSPLTSLVTALDEATGGTVHLMEFRALTWPRETYASGVVLAVTSLRTWGGRNR